MGELTPVAWADFWTALDLVPVVLLVVGCYAVARSRSRAVAVLWATLRQLGRHRRATVVGVGLAAGLMAVVVSSARPPIPVIQDEFSYLLAADTFAHGRVTNPTHPHWQHFETFQVIHEPTYMSKYPPAQGLVLGLGQWLTGQALTGVWISTALAAAAVCWMLQGWVPGRWALLGSLFLLANVTIHITWGQTFWGGQAALLGGALVYGALPRILGGKGLAATLALVTGVAILANSRPFEGLVVSLPAALALLVWFARRDGPSMGFRLTRIVLPGCIVLACVALAMGYYNHRVTGDALEMPYVVHEETYDMAPLFLWGTPRPAPDYRHPSIRDAYVWMQNFYEHQRSRSVSELATVQVANAARVAWRLYSPALLLPLLALPWAVRRPHMRWVALAVAGNYLALAAATWNGLSHYYAPALAPAWLVIVQGLRQIHLVRIDGRPLGRYLVPGLLVTQVVIFTVVASAYVSRELNYRPEPVLRPSQARARIQGDLLSRPGRHLVMVRYDPEREMFFPWSANRADIDSAPVVWAQSMEAEEDARLFTYFEDRQVWWLYHDGHDWQISAHKAAKSPASAQRESKRTSSRSIISIAGRPDAAMLRASSLMSSRSAVSTPGAP